MRIEETLRIIKRNRRHLTRQQQRTLCGQARSGDTVAALKGLDAILQKGGGARMNELKQCPFCGSSDAHTKRHYNQWGEVWWGVKCHKCGAEIVSKLYDLPTDAMDAWNRRYSNDMP